MTTDIREALKKAAKKAAIRVSPASVHDVSMLFRCGFMFDDVSRLLYKQIVSEVRSLDDEDMITLRNASEFLGLVKQGRDVVAKGVVGKGTIEAIDVYKQCLVAWSRLSYPSALNYVSSITSDEQFGDYIDELKSKIDTMIESKSSYGVAIGEIEEFFKSLNEQNFQEIQMRVL